MLRQSKNRDFSTNNFYVHFQVLLGEPLVEETRGLWILEFLRLSVTELKTELKELFDKVIPRLKQSLVEDDDDKPKKDFDIQIWQDLILKVKTIAKILRCLAIERRGKSNKIRGNAKLNESNEK